VLDVYLLTCKCGWIHVYVYVSSSGVPITFSLQICKSGLRTRI